MKKLLALLVFATAAGITLGQDSTPPDNGGGRGDRGGMRGGMRGDRGGMRGDRGGMRGGMGMMPMRVDPRVQAEEELAKKCPEDFAALVKERKAVEEKMQALAKKNEVTLPMSAETRREKMAEFQKKYEKELKEMEELRKTDPRAAWEKQRALLQKEGLDPFAGMNRRDGNRGDESGKGGEANPPPPRENRMARLAEELKTAYPEDYAAYEKLRRDDPDAARAKYVAMVRKYQESKKSGK